MALVRVISSQAKGYEGVWYEDLISCECISPAELDAEIDRLQEELETVRRKARKRFSKAA